MLFSKFIKKNKKEDLYYSTEEYKFYSENKKIIEKVKSFFPTNDNFGFKLICSNILIRAFLNKQFIEENLSEFEGLSLNDCFKKVTEMFENRPHILKKDGEKVYFPQLSTSFNYLYTHKTTSIRKYPYSTILEKPNLYCIDLFDEYGFELFSSSFSDLNLIFIHHKSAVFYSHSFETIYVVNDQGRLDIAIPLFDSKMTEKNYENIEERVKKVMEVFYDNKRKWFVKALFDEGFISDKAYRNLLRNKKLDKIKKNSLKKGEKK